MALITCSCCGAELTAPQFHNGKPYGYTCIEKIRPGTQKSKMKYVSCEIIKDCTGAGCARKELILALDNTKIKTVVYVSKDHCADDMTGQRINVSLGTKTQPSKEAQEFIKAGADLSSIYNKRI